MSKKPKREPQHPDSGIDFLASENVLSHAGEWVAILDRKVIASGRSLEEVHREASRKAKDRKPTYYAVPTASALY